jgi:hypothetical protein
MPSEKGDKQIAFANHFLALGVVSPWNQPENRASGFETVDFNVAKLPLPDQQRGQVPCVDIVQYRRCGIVVTPEQCRKPLGCCFSAQQVIQAARGVFMVYCRRGPRGGLNGAVNESHQECCRISLAGHIADDESVFAANPERVAEIASDILRGNAFRSEFQFGGFRIP